MELVGDHTVTALSYYEENFSVGDYIVLNF